MCNSLFGLRIMTEIHFMYCIIYIILHYLHYITLFTLCTLCDCLSNYVQLWLIQIVFWNNKLYNHSAIHFLARNRPGSLFEQSHIEIKIKWDCEKTNLSHWLVSNFMPTDSKKFEFQFNHQILHQKLL